MRVVTILIFIIFAFILKINAQNAQNAQTSADTTYAKNTAERMMSKDARLTIGGYAQIDYNQPLGKTKENGLLDVHRLVLLFGYKFDKKTQFITEIEYEHVNEIFVEQAFLQHKFNNYFNLRAGLMLVPMGIVNEYHEPPTYRGVERPNLDKYIVPSTWREIGAGFSGRIDEASLRYQAYLFNGFKSYTNGVANLNGKNGLRGGRQKGAKSFSSTPNFSFKLDYYGVSSLKLGLSGYFGNTQSTAYDGVNKNDVNALAMADSTVVGVNMIGLDARYNVSGVLLRGQYNFVSLSNTLEYNALTGSDVGSNLSGYYLELGYDVFHTNKQVKTQLIPFVRYEKYNTQQSTEGFEANNAYDRTEITVGVDWKLTPGSVLKADYQFFKTGGSDDFNGQLNLGVGVWFN